MKAFYTFLVVVIFVQYCFAEKFAHKETLQSGFPDGLLIETVNKNFPDKSFNPDSVNHSTDNRFRLTQVIAPTVLISTGTVLHLSNNTKNNIQRLTRKNLSYSGNADDYLRYAPLAAVYGLNFIGIKGKNNFGNRTAIAVKSLALNHLIVSSLKTLSNSPRPNGMPRSFPSGHTSSAFALAHFMHHEYGNQSVWYSVGAYSCATTVAIMRVAKNAHWVSDVVAGAGFGILSTEMVYLTHQYKWNNKHIRNFDIFPWGNQNQSGLAVIYRF